MLLDVRLDADLPAVPGVVAELAEAGVGGVFTYEGPHDPFLPLALAAVASTSMALYTNLAVALPRSPMHLAYLAHDLQLASGGRFSLGLGTQVKAHVTRRFGATWESPVEQMREWVGALRAIHRAWETGEPLDFVGRWTQHTYCPPLFVPPPAPAAPVLLGALGPRMTALAVEVADGLLVHPFNTRLSVETMLADVPADFPVIGQAVVAVVDDDPTPARTAVRSLVGFYASTPAYRRVLDVHGWGDLQTDLRELTRAGRWSDLPGAVPDEVVDEVALIGTASEVARGLRERFPRSERVALSTPHPVPAAALATLADALR
ncbi:MAG TPA: TIGR03617 family F420-dependent LLM class oxidoreductase [Mycobacteriales bacterium]|nr:TIGR03617 family F420-dependent LLM class oxidoreductase [Mycobacteriales bacterium]